MTIQAMASRARASAQGHSGGVSGRREGGARLLLLGHDVVQAVVEELQALLQQRRDAQLQAVAVARVRRRLRGLCLIA